MRTLVLLAGFAAVIGMATPAQADPTSSSGSDASFLAALDKAGITYGDGSLAVKVGKRACDLMNEGSPQVDVIKQVSSSNPGFTVDGAAQFTMIAAGVYCPQHMGQAVATHEPAAPASPPLAPNGLAPEPPPPPPPPPAA
jgi:Protein of unknown function (DUF732)